MTNRRLTILAVGATGSIGRLVVEEAIRQGHAVRALVRSASKARQLPREAETVIGDLTRPETLSAAVDGIDAVVFTHGSDGGGKIGAETVDYGGVRNVLAAVGSHTARIALMTAIGVTNRNSSYNRSTESHDWKRRSERLIRASGLPYTIVRPGWFDYNGPDEHKLVLLQGDKRHSGTPKDGAIARRQIAEVLVRSLTSDQAVRKTFELISAKGPEKKNLMRYSHHWTPIRKARSTLFMMHRTCRSKTSLSACGKIWMRCAHTDFVQRPDAPSGFTGR